MSNGYKEITIPTNVPKSIVAIEIEEDEAPLADDEGMEVDTVSGQSKKTFVPAEDTPSKRKSSMTVTFAEDEQPQDEDIVDVEESAEVEAPVEAKPQHQKPSRANKRIRQLASEKNELAAQLERERQEKEELRRQLMKGYKENKTSTKASLETTMAVLNRELKSAMENADYDKIIEIQEKIMDCKDSLKVVELEMAQVEDASFEQEEAEAPRTSQRQPKVSEKAMAWVEEHPMFKSDEVFYAAAMAINNKLIREGFDPESDEFYAELDERLAPRFPEVFGIEEESDVEYTREQEIAPKSVQRDVKPKPSSKKPQTVSGASRTPTSSPTARKSKNNTVRLGPEDLAHLDRWGMDVKTLALQKHNIENNRRDDGYVPILIPQDR